MNAPKRDIPGLKPYFRQEQELNDRLLRLLGIPFFGIAIPNIIGLFGTLQLSGGMYWLGDPYFIFVALVIWQGNRRLLFKQREHHNWYRSALHVQFAQYLVLPDRERRTAGPALQRQAGRRLPLYPEQ